MLQKDQHDECVRNRPWINVGPSVAGVKDVRLMNRGEGKL